MLQTVIENCLILFP